MINQNKNFFLENGYVVLKNVVPEEHIKEYENLWIQTHTSGFDKENNLIINSPNGWSSSNSYLSHKEILNILCHENIFNFLNLINDKLALHLSFTGWTSTLKTWHQDWTTSDKDAAQNYIGVWVALDKIHPDSGPFQFIPGSHLWDINYEMVYKKENMTKVQDFLVEECIKRSAQAFSFLADRGDAIVWSGHLIHRGSTPNDFKLLRKSIIGHYGILSSDVLPYQNGFYHSNKSSGIDLYA